MVRRPTSPARAGPIRSPPSSHWRWRCGFLWTWPTPPTAWRGRFPARLPKGRARAIWAARFPRRTWARRWFSARPDVASEGPPNCPGRAFRALCPSSTRGRGGPMSQTNPLNAAFFAFRKRARGGVLTQLAIAYLVLFLVLAGGFVALNLSALISFFQWYG